MEISEDEYLMHYGVLRKSGRYPWGSGGETRPYPWGGGKTQSIRNRSFLDHIEELRKSGMSEVDIAKGFGMKTSKLRDVKSIAINEQRASQQAQAQRLKDKGLSHGAIATKMGLAGESSVRAILAPGQKDKIDQLKITAGLLKQHVAEKKYLDVGSGTEHYLDINKDRLGTAVTMLTEEGYTIHYVKMPQAATGLLTTHKVLAGPGVTGKEVWHNRDKIQQIQAFSDDGGRTNLGIQYPMSISSKRIHVRYKEDGGDQEDGVIHVRPGVKDVSIGGSNYAQVRVAVDGTHYLKGMAVYKDNLPDGADLVFNTTKSRGGNKLDAMKPLKDDKDNPFGAVINRQVIEVDSKGKEKLTSTMNLINEEGDWAGWSRSLSSQTLSKQSPVLAKAQLNMTLEKNRHQYDEIMALTNPVIKKKLLEKFADSVDSSAAHLEAARLPRSSWHVILPVPKMKPTEVYAPNFRDGERVALIRFPHGGLFEIPELTVNNKQPEARKIMGRAKDAIGIHPKVAERLSGADFDGDAVMVIPNGQGKIKSAPALQGLKNFAPRDAFPGYPGMTVMTKEMKAQQMGLVSNLITDMTIKKASNDEIARAIRHSMVVIDAEKHELNYKESARVNGIAALQKRYQNRAQGGASTLISRAGSKIQVPLFELERASKGGPIDRATGKKVFRDHPESFINKDGQVVIKKVWTKKLAETDNAYSLIDGIGTPIERVYADHSNTLKALANKARKDAINTPPLKSSPSAKKAYAAEVASLDVKLALAQKNRPLERQAQIFAATVIRQKQDAKPDMSYAELSKIRYQALTAARIRTQAKKHEIKIEDNEWAAIQAGAISNHKLVQILNKADIDRVKKLATPKTPIAMTPVKYRRAQTMLSSGYTRADVADQLGVSLSTLDTALKG